MLWLARLAGWTSWACPPAAPIQRRPPQTLTLPRLLTGERVLPGLVAGMGQGGSLGRSMRFRFPDDARDLEAPDG